MITSHWFLEHIQDRQDLLNYSMAEEITPEEYKELKKQAEAYCKPLTGRFYLQYKWNRNVANELKSIYNKILERMRCIEHGTNQEC